LRGLAPAAALNTPPPITLTPPSAKKARVPPQGERAPGGGARSRFLSTRISFANDDPRSPSVRKTHSPGGRGLKSPRGARAWRGLGEGARDPLPARGGGRRAPGWRPAAPRKRT